MERRDHQKGEKEDQEDRLFHRSEEPPPIFVLSRELYDILSTKTRTLFWLRLTKEHSLMPKYAQKVQRRAKYA